MRNFYEDFKIDRKPILAPDQDLGLSKQDLDSEGSGRDELGYMHRIVLRKRVATWNLIYATMSEYEYEYMNALLEQPEFDLDIRMGTKHIKTRGYCSSVKGSLHNGKKGIYKSVSFSIIEC